MSIELQLMSSSNIWIVPKMLVDIKVDTHFTEINDWPKYVFQVILWQFVNCMTWVQILQIKQCKSEIFTQYTRLHGFDFRNINQIIK